MTIQERLRRSNLVMLVVPVVIAGVLFAAGLGALALLLNAVYLPRLGLTFKDLHSIGEEMEQVFRGLKLFVVLYAAVVLAALLAAVAFTNLYLTRALFAHIQKPLDILLQWVQCIQNGDLETPICYQEADEFRPACDAVDAMAVQLRDSLQQQREQQKKQELIAGMSHDLKSPLTTIRAYTEALLEGVAPDEAARQRYLQTIYARETDLEALVNRLFELAKLGVRVKAHLAQYDRLKPAAAVPQTITAGPLTADPLTRRVTKNGIEIPLKNKEYELLLFLMRHPEQVFSREDLYELIWGLESLGDNITVAVHINRLREKIEDDPAASRLLQTVWGVGYRLHAV